MTTDKIIFTVSDIELLRLRAKRDREQLTASGFYPRETLAEKMYLFARDYREGNTWHTEKSERFAVIIKKHLASVRSARDRRMTGGQS